MAEDMVGIKDFDIYQTATLILNIAVHQVKTTDNVTKSSDLRLTPEVVSDAANLAFLILDIIEDRRSSKP